MSRNATSNGSYFQIMDSVERESPRGQLLARVGFQQRLREMAHLVALHHKHPAHNHVRTHTHLQGIQLAGSQILVRSFGSAEQRARMEEGTQNNNDEKIETGWTLHVARTHRVGSNQLLSSAEVVRPQTPRKKNQLVKTRSWVCRLEAYARFSTLIRQLRQVLPAAQTGACDLTEGCASAAC